MFGSFFTTKSLFEIDIEKRVFGFDFLRALAIFFVVHGHGRHLLENTILAGFPWFNLPHGVDIFFVLSGFLIANNFIKKANLSGKRFQINDSILFWKRSALRILPNYYLILLVNYSLVSSGILNGSNEKFGILLFVTFTQNLYSPFYDFFWESWSLATQQWFYLFFPILFYFINTKLNVKTSIIVISIFFISLSIFYRIHINSHYYDSFWWDVSFRKVALSRIDSIFYGVLAAFFRIYYQKIWYKFRYYFFSIGIFIFLIFNIFNIKEYPIFYNIFYLSTSPIYIALWLPLIEDLKVSNKTFIKIISYFSVLSYAVYLLNLLIIQLLNKHLFVTINGFGIPKYFLFWLLIIISSLILYHFVEKPFSKLRQKSTSNQKI